MRLTKSKLTDMVALLNKATTLSTLTIWYSDIVQPITFNSNDPEIQMWSNSTDLLNGVHLLQNTLIDIPDDKVYLLDLNSKDLSNVKERIKMTGITSINVDFVEETGLVVNIDNDSYIILEELIITKPDKNIMYESFSSRYNYLLTLGQIYNSKDEYVLNIVNGSRVILDTEHGPVRVSKNLFPLFGPVRKDDKTAVKFNYLSTMSSTGPVIIIFAKYKKYNAIHMYSFIEFTN